MSQTLTEDYNQTSPLIKENQLNSYHQGKNH